MKRSLSLTFWVGAFAGALVLILQKCGLLLRPEALFDRVFLGVPLPNERIGLGGWLLVFGLGFAVAWTLAQVTEWPRRGALLVVLLAELVGAAWVLHWAGVAFQPVPGILVSLLAAAGAIGVGSTQTGRRRRVAAALFAGRLAPREIDRLTDGRIRDLAAPQNCEVSLVFAEIGNLAELVDELAPADYARVMARLAEEASACFLAEGGYLHAADGEGLRILFGFPQALEAHAAAAAQAALAFRDRIALAAFKEPESLGKIALRVGISSGVIVATVPEGASPGDVLISGEPVELARRLAAANQIYGSKILLGPRAYNSAGAHIVARPIDFLRSSEAHERVEVYELLALTADASAEEIACRDRFWNGLVYFRERRWSESFAEFSSARPANPENDQPLQWYLRRLEPLILQMATEPTPVTEPLSPL